MEKRRINPASILAEEEELGSIAMRYFFPVFLKLKNAREVKKFLRDLCTISELKALSERWQVATLLQQGLSYLEISKQTKVSTATITRVAHWLHHGAGGYQFMLERFGHRPRAKKT